MTSLFASPGRKRPPTDAILAPGLIILATRLAFAHLWRKRGERCRSSSFTQQPDEVDAKTLYSDASAPPIANRGRNSTRSIPTRSHQSAPRKITAANRGTSPAKMPGLPAPDPFQVEVGAEAGCRSPLAPGLARPGYREACRRGNLPRICKYQDRSPHADRFL